jgi:hypothetical protein
MSASFEVDRLEWVEPDRLEVAGRWYGVRGLRFVRPSLDLEAGDERRHLLAVLDHKPWAALDGEDWVAAFPWDGDKVELSHAELAVTPAVVVELPLPGRNGKPRAARKGEKKPKKAAPARRVPASDRGRDDRIRAEAQALRQERDAALAARDDAAQARDEAIAARDAMAAERDEAVRGRDALAETHNAAVAAQHEAVSDRDAASAARSAALTEVESAMAERDAAIRKRQAAQQERDQMKHALKASRDAVKSANAARDDAMRARDELAQQHTAARAANEVSAAPPVVADEQSSPWPVRAIVVGALVVLLVIFVAVLQGAF